MNRDRALATVVVPLFNKRHTIQRALRSVVQQTYSDWELLVVDDGSTDGSSDLAREIEDSRITVFRRENGGPGAARNTGLARAKGTLITFLDADDEWDEAFLATAVNCLEAHPECVAFISKHRIVERGRSILSGRASRRTQSGPTRLDPRMRRDEIAWCLEDFHACSSVFRTGVVQAFGGFFAEDRCSYAEDVYLWIQIRMNHPIYRHADPLASYHLDASELGISGRRGHLPMEPVFAHAGRVRRCCSVNMLPAFEIWLGRHAIRAAFLHVQAGRPNLARRLMALIPEMRRWPLPHLHLRARLAFPRLWRAREILHAVLRPPTVPSTTVSADGAL